MCWQANLFKSTLHHFYYSTKVRVFNVSGHSFCVTNPSVNCSSFISLKQLKLPSITYRFISHESTKDVMFTAPSLLLTIFQMLHSWSSTVRAGCITEIPEDEWNNSSSLSYDPTPTRSLFYCLDFEPWSKAVKCSFPKWCEHQKAAVRINKDKNLLGGISNIPGSCSISPQGEKAIRVPRWDELMVQAVLALMTSLVFLLYIPLTIFCSFYCILAFVTKLEGNGASLDIYGCK